MQNRHLVKAIVDMAVFLEFTDEDVLNPDISMAALEQLANELQCMSESEKSSVAECIRELATSYGERSEFVVSLPENLGIAS
ncbi:hypothetical protein ACFSHT_02505 [Paraburkholderia silviterrae]|uniref:Uncharacterized protein n=1 Tax=Paraburkholderia silviterrae TaxID=2528715 RepID=A0A4R5MGL7_9BURK|nr:hypothetical protein [Paraburkholderia silviterrae]TDG26459.1 hypothetical protein EYW47_03700 [Paraburkholderia silviterrae]